jgi:ATP:ADP antiporter, AAA family
VPSFRSSVALPLRSRFQSPILARMTLMYFLVMCSLGVLKPLKNAFALVGLGNTHFYRVYFVGAVVVLFVPLYSRIADRVPLGRLTTGIALLFGANLLLFRLLYQEGSVAFSLVFYGWYDLFTAVAVTQFFLAAQWVFNTREARGAYPIIIGGGAVGAALGGAITGFGATQLGTSNLLVVAAVFLVLFGLVVPRSWNSDAAPSPGGRPTRPRRGKLSAGELQSLLTDPHVRLIALTVLLGVLVKQLVDYQFNTITGQIFVTGEAISAFQGKFNAATQWLPLVVLVALRPALQRWGVGVALFLLPVALLAANLGLAVWWGLSAAVLAKAADIGLRHTADRTGREILYLPVPENIKLKAKVYIDVAIEEGLGKLLSALLIGGLLALIGYHYVGYAAAALTLLWLAAIVAIRREYVRTLARSIEGRFASMQGHFASLANASTLPVLRRALGSADTLQTAFALDLVDQLEAAEARQLAAELHALLGHDDAGIRHLALTTLCRCSDVADVERVRACVSDADAGVREAAIQALCAARPDHAAATLEELLRSANSVVREAALTALARGALPAEAARRLSLAHLERCRAAAPWQDTAARIEVALAAAALESDGSTLALLEPLLEDPEPQVRIAALHTAGKLQYHGGYARIVAALRDPRTREAAREALLQLGDGIAERIAADLCSDATDLAVRRQLPAVLAGSPSQATVDALLDSAAAAEADGLLDHRTLKVLNQLRTRAPDLRFDVAAIEGVLEREVAAARRYREAAAPIEAGAKQTTTLALLGRSVRESWADRRERAFRCLGLLLPPAETYRCYLAVAGGNTTAHANALEWLEHQLGHAAFTRLAPVLTPIQAAPAAPRPLREVLDELAADADGWISACATEAKQEILAATVRLHFVNEAVVAEGGSQLTRPQAKLRLATGDAPHWRKGDHEMNLIEKVFLLQQVDLLQGARSAHLALLASIAEEYDAAPGTVLLRQGEPTDALYVVIHGAVELRGMGEQLLVARDGTPFGTWALIDEAPSLVSARATEPTRLLRITRHDFYDLLADHHELARGLLQGLARRVRTLVS